MAEWKELPSYLLEPAEPVSPEPPFHCDYCDCPVSWGSIFYAVHSTEGTMRFCSEHCAVQWFKEFELQEDVAE